MSKVSDWLKDEGVKMAVALLIGLLLYIAWRIIVYFLVKGLTKSGIKSLELSRKALIKSIELSKNGLVHIVSDEQLEVTEVTDEERQQVRLRTQTIGGIMKNIGAFIIAIIVLIQMMDAAGVPTTSLLTGAALIGLALAFAVQTIVGDFVSGLFILIEGGYNVEDWVTINDLFGQVEELALRVSKLRALDGTLFTIPNGEIRTIKNHSKDFNVNVTIVGITYESNVDECIEILNTTVSDAIVNDNRVQNLLIGKPHVDGFSELAGSSVNIRLVSKCKAGSMILVNRISMEYVKKYLGNELAYPTMRMINETKEQKN